MKRYKFRKSFTFNGKRYYAYGDTEADVEAKLQLKRQSVERNTVLYNGEMTVKQWADRAVPIYKTGQADITRKKYVNRMNHCIIESIGHMKLRQVLPIHLQQVINAQAGKSKRHINEVHQQIRFLFKTAHQNGLIESDPSEGIAKPQGKSGTRRAITAQERNALIEVCKDDRYMMFLLMLYCGLRPSEAMEAKGSDIIYRNGKAFLHVRGTKTKNADRTVPIPDVLMKRLTSKRKHQYLADHDGKKHTRTSYDRLTKRLYREMNLAMGATTYRNALTSQPLASDFTPYCLRHTYCSDLAKMGVDIRTAQKLMGHSDITLTANIYTHVDYDQLMDVHDIINNG